MAQVHLSDHFTYKKILKAAYPPILMMVFTSLYGIVDGLFISNFVGTSAFAAINYIIPVSMALGAVGFMFGAGGSAIVSQTLGEGNPERAKGIFTGVVIVNAALGLVLSIILFFFIEPVSVLLKATESMLPYCTVYGRIIILGAISFMTQNLFQSFFIVAEKPMLGFKVTVAAGVTNMVLDALFVAVFNWGVAGAAIATVISQVVGSVIPIVYFLRKNNSLLCFTKPIFEFGVILKTITNGSSEFLSNISASLVSMIYNARLLECAGEDGVSAYGVIMYASFIFSAVFIGYSIAMSPVVGYHYGAKNAPELKNVLKKSLVINVSLGLIMAGLSIILARPLSMIFVSADIDLLNLTVSAMRIFSIGFIFMGINIYTSSFFTALGNGLISAIVSAFRTLVCQISMVYLLSYLFGVTGIWTSIIAAEFLAMILSIVFLALYRKKYGY